MKKIFSIICLVLGIAACTDEQVGPQTPSTNEAQTALELVNSFRANIQGQSRSNSLTDLTILDVSKEAISFKKKGTSPQSRSQEDDCIQDVEIYTFTFENNGQKGFAISVPDERINQVLAYCENGSIADTAYIEGFSRVINNIPYTCAEILEYNLYSPYQHSPIQNVQTINNFMQTAWGQGYPYNSYCRQTSCPGGYATVGATGIATAQVIAYMSYHPSNYDLSELKKQQHISQGDPLADEAGRFIYEVAQGCNTLFACNSSYASIQNASNYLNEIGYNRIGAPRAEYKKSSSFNEEKLTQSLQGRNPVMAFGNSKNKGGYTWLYTGMIRIIDIETQETIQLLSLYLYS